MAVFKFFYVFFWFAKFCAQNQPPSIPSVSKMKKMDKDYESDMEKMRHSFELCMNPGNLAQGSK
jgi:hypothetical protein